MGLVIAVIYVVATNLHTTLRAVKSQQGTNEYVLALTNALQVWLALNLVFGLVSFGLTSYEWYFMAGLSEVVKRLAHDSCDPVSLPVRSPRTHPMLSGVRGVRVA